MSALTDLQAEADAIRDSAVALQASVVTLQTDVTATLAAIQKLIDSQGTGDTDAINAAVAELKGAGTALDQSNADVTKAGTDLTAALPPA